MNYPIQWMNASKPVKQTRKIKLMINFSWSLASEVHPAETSGSRKNYSQRTVQKYLVSENNWNDNSW